MNDPNRARRRLTPQQKEEAQGCLGQLQIQRRAERVVMPFGKSFEIPGAAATTQDPQDRH